MTLDSSFKKNFILEVEEYTVRTLMVQDVGPEYLSWFKDPEVIAFIEFAQKDVSIDELKTFVTSKLESSDALLLGIFCEKSHVGNIKFEPIDLQNKSAVMGILIGNKEFRSKGVGTLVLRETCMALNKLLGLKTVELGVSRDNERAQKSYLRSGFTIVSESNYISNEKGIIMRISL